MNEIKLTKYSHGAGCGCKISPKVLDQILSDQRTGIIDPRLIVGNGTNDDAAVYALDDSTGIISTTDFFMPIVDDPFDFGAIAATNAISDVYAMGGSPIMAISILGWPVDKLPAEVAKEVIAGARKVCSQASIALAGGHSIDTPEPIFGLAVTGIAKLSDIKQNSHATEGASLFVTKPLGVGILTTAQKKGVLHEDDLQNVRNLMLQLNAVGEKLGKIPQVTAMTDVTGFGLLGHLLEICEGSNTSAEIDFLKIPLIDNVNKYLDLGCVPGGTNRNFSSYGHKISSMTEFQKNILCDPQTSGGLLIAVEQGKEESVKQLLLSNDLNAESFGQILPKGENVIEVI